MTKKQTVELLQKQLPSFYSLEQVIDIVNGIDEKTSLNLDEKKLEEIHDVVVSKVYDIVNYAIGNMYVDSLIDVDSAEFSLSGNKISLDSVDINKKQISDTLSDVCGIVVKDILEKYVS